MTCMITLRNLARLTAWSLVFGVVIGFLLFGFDAPRRVGTAVTGWLQSVSDWGRPVPPPVPPAEEAVRTAVELLVAENERKSAEEKRTKKVEDTLQRLTTEESVALPSVGCCPICGRTTCK